MSGLPTLGTSVVRLGSEEKVRGSARFAADLAGDDCLRAALLRSPVPHARIARLDVSAARALTGVCCVLTGDDLRGLRTGMVLRDMPLLCADLVRYVGDPVAAVAAVDAVTASAALELVEVEYEQLPAIVKPADAMRAGSSPIHPDISSYAGSHTRSGFPEVPNLQGYRLVEKGDVGAGLAAADLTFEHTFRTARVHQGYLEPRACVVRPGEHGGPTIWTSCKAPHLLRDLVADLIGLSTEQVVVRPVVVGGDFGAKGPVGPEPLMCLLSRATGRAVAYQPGYDEELCCGNPRHPSVVTVRTGVTAGGRILAREMRVVLDGGAYGAYKGTPEIDVPYVTRGLGPYVIPHTRVECLIAYTNNVPGGIARAPGQPQVVFAGESQVDIIAEHLGMDPLDFRLANVLAAGDVWPDGELFEAVAARETLEAVRRISGWDGPVDRNRGRGVAVTEHGIGAGPCGMIASLDAAGCVTVQCGVPDVGTGTHTVLRQMVAGELGLPLDAVTVAVGDTAETLPDAGSSGSKVTFGIGLAAADVTSDLRAQVAAVVADDLGCAAEELERDEAGFRARGASGASVPFRAAYARAAARRGGRLESRSGGPGSRRTRVICSVATVVEVLVDPETGVVLPVRVSAAVDVGRALNPALVRGQVAGGVVQGLGQALMEEMVSANGRLGTVNLDGYRIPTTVDIPDLVIQLVPGGGAGPFGAKAVGELAHCPVPAAVANAVASAVRARVLDLPITSERVHWALGSARKAPAESTP